MWRTILIALCLAAWPCLARSQERGWDICAAGPTTSACGPAGAAIDPQGRSLWLRQILERPSGHRPQALYIVGVASSEAWLNGVPLGANGRPGLSAAGEVPGRYQIALPVSDTLWRPGANELVVRMSSFHGAIRLDRPIAALRVAPYPYPSGAGQIALTFVAAGALFAAAFGFGVIHSQRRTGSSLALAAMAGVAGLQAVVESLRVLVPYTYPFHAWRLVGIWLLASAFAVLLVAYVASRFWPVARHRLIGLAALLCAATWFVPGFDLKTGLVLIVGVVLALAAALVAVRRRLPAARQAASYLIAFLAFACFFPEWLVDLSYFLFAAGLVLPLLMVEVVRLGRDQHRREAALVRAADKPNCLTVASSRGVERVPLADIIAIVGADDYVELRRVGGRRLLHATRLDRLEDVLPAAFLRVHRSVIVSLRHVIRLERSGSRWSVVTVEDGAFPVSRTRLAPLRDALRTSDGALMAGAEGAVE